MSQEYPAIKPENLLQDEAEPVEQPSTPSRGGGRKRRGRGRPSLASLATEAPPTSEAKRPRTSASASKTPRGGGRGRGRGGGGGGRGGARTKAAKSAAGVARSEEDEDFAQIAAKTLDYAEESSDGRDDDDDDAGSDYVPPDAGRMSQLEAEEDDLEEEEEDDDEDDIDEEDDDEQTSRRRRGRRSGAAGRQRRSLANDTTLEDPFGGLTDYEEEDDEDDDEMQESRINLMNEVSALQGFRNAPGESMSLFADMAAAAVAAAAANAGEEGAGDGKDIYDFDAQSIASDKRFRKIKQAAAARQRRSATARKSRPQASGTSQAGASWGSNIYSALATSLKTRTDLDAYTNFLKCPYLNNAMDTMLVDLCRPSNQHMGLFFGPSASLQSLMGRVNDPDRVVELLHAFMSKPYDTLSNRILWFAPIIHQQPVPLSNIPAYSRQLSELSEGLDSDMRIEPAYILEAPLNVLVQTGVPFTNLEVSLNQYNAINGAGNLGRFMTDVGQIVLSNDFWDQLNDLVALPYEKIISFAERAPAEGGDGFVNIEAIEPPCLNRVIAAVNSDNQILGLALTDTWELNKAPLSRTRRNLSFQNLQRGPLQLSGIDQTSVVNGELPIELDTYGVLEQIIDTVSDIRQHEEEATEPSTVRTDPKIGRVHLMDCFLLKLNSRKDSLVLICFENSVSPPLPSNRPSGSAPYKVYSLVSEESFFFTRFGITSDSPALMDGMFTADPEALTERKAVAILPDVVFDNLRSIALREIVASSGTAIVNAVLANINTTVTPCETPTLYRCSKFILVDSQRRVPLAIVFEVPIRLSWATETNKCAVRSLDTNSLNADFMSVSAEALESAEQKFNSSITECRLVAINGLLYALQVDENRVLQRVIELVPAGYDNITGHPNHAALAPRAISGDARASNAYLRIFNEESATSSVFPAVYLPHYSQQTIVEQVTSFCDELVDHIYTSPVSFSLYDVVFRMAIKHTPKMLARQHHEAAVAAAAASAAANPDDPPPPPVPMPEHWGVCSVCSKELHSVSGLLEHELRHVGLTKFRCNEHRVCFMDRRGLILHMSVHGGPSSVGGGDRADDEEGPNETTIGEEDIKFIPGLSNVFARSSLLSGRMEAPQCDSCRDFFPTADVMAQHLEICDGISFSIRSPIEHAVIGGVDDKSVCGICGQAVEDIKQHFTEVHLVCALCQMQLHTIEELSYHYKVHVETSNAENAQKLGEVTTCETCLNFYSSKHNYYFHQWAEHGVIFKQDPVAGSLTPVQVRESRTRLLDDQEVTSKLKCKFCQFICPCSGKQYVDHLKLAHSITSDVSLVCRFCAEIFANLDELSAHLQATHSPLSDYRDAGPQTVYSCEQCETVQQPFYAFHKGMLDHAREVHSILTPNMYQCPRCKERFSDRKLHRQHFETHAEGELYPCVECGKEFRSKQALRHHEQMRHDVEWDTGPATCEHCGITYPKRSALKYHIARMHNVVSFFFIG